MAHSAAQNRSWDRKRRLVAKVEWHPGELCPRGDFIITNLRRPAQRVVEFYNQRGTAEQWIKEARRRSNGRGCHVAGRAAECGGVVCPDEARALVADRHQGEVRGILGLSLQRAEEDKPKRVSVSSSKGVKRVAAPKKSAAASKKSGKRAKK